MSDPIRLALRREVSHPRVLRATATAQDMSGAIHVVLESRSGAKGSARERNPDYHDALELILGRAAAHRMSIADLQVVSAPALKLPSEDRRLPLAMPIALAGVGVHNLRKRITESQRAVARSPRSVNTAGGNNNKRLLIVLIPSETVPDATALEALLALGTPFHHVAPHQPPTGRAES